MKVLKENVLFDNRKRITELLEDLNINIENDRFSLDGEDVTEDIRKSKIVENVSRVVAIRERMVDIQRNFAEHQDRK